MRRPALDRRRLKALLARLEPERLRGVYLARKMRALPHTEFHSANGRLPLVPGLRDLVLGRRRPGAGGAPVADHVQKLDGVCSRYRLAPGSRILEIGCHEGALLDHLRSRGYSNLHGVDYAEYHGSDLELGSSRGGVEIDYRGFADADLGRCDLVYCFDTFEHLDEWPLFLDRVWGALAPGGVAYIHYNPFAGINGAHSPGTVDVPWGHVFLKEDEHLAMVRDADPVNGDANVLFVERFLNRVRLVDVSRRLDSLGADFVLLPHASAGDRVLFAELFRGFTPPFVSEELFVREVELILYKPAV